MAEYFSTFGIKDLIDVLCVALILFYLYKLMKRSGSMNMFLGIVVFILVWMLVSQVFKMQLLGAILDKLVDVGVLALIVLFAEDIRRFFRGIGTHTRTGGITRWLFKRKASDGDTSRWQPLVKACADMSSRKCGALVVIQQNDELRDAIQIGEYVNADMNQLLIENIFFKNSPLHDGAMILNGGRIEAAACVLPVSEDESVPKSFGTRHRAALGITQKTDAIAVVVSEETGRISVFNGDKYRIGITPDELAEFLANPTIE